MYTLAEIIERLSQSMQEHEIKVTRSSEFTKLSVTQIHYLDAIRHLDKPSVSELANYMKVSKPTATIALEKLEKAGYITKVNSSEDRRVSYIHLTQNGLKISNLHDAIHQGYAKNFEQSLTPDELKTIIDLMNKVVDYLKL